MYIGKRAIIIFSAGNQKQAWRTTPVSPRRESESAPVCQGLAIRGSFNRDPPSMGVPLGWLFLA